MIEIKVSRDIAIAEYIKGEYPDAKGYLLHESNLDKKKGLFSCIIFSFDEEKCSVLLPINGNITEKRIQNAINKNKLLNGHAHIVEFTSGWINDDFSKKRIRLKLTYSFK